MNGTFQLSKINAANMQDLYTPLPRFAHHLSSRTCTNGQMLVVTSYDYFLQRRDLRVLLGQFQEIVLMPRQSDSEYLVQESIGPLLERYDNLLLVTNTQFDTRYQLIQKLAVEREKQIRLQTVEDFCEKTLRKVYVPEEMSDMPQTNGLRAFNWLERAFKKGLDVLVSGLLILFSSPVWALSAYIIRRQSPGSVFYTQDRVGIRQSTVRVIKFRSMRTDAEVNGARFSTRNDNRTFPYGKIMRATRIDELPQLLNIYRGNLSLIGPRPERKVFTDSFEEVIPGYQLRHLVKPGISGYAQVMYPYGSGVRDARHKLMYDLYYIKHWSVLLELEIVLRTVWTIVSRRGI